MAARAVQLTPAPHCVRDCRLVGWLDEQRWLGLAVESDDAACAECLAYVRWTRDPARLRVPLRPRAARRGLSQLEPSRWEEAIETVVVALRQVLRRELDLVWVSLQRRPRLLGLIPQRVGRLVPRALYLNLGADASAIARRCALLGARPLDRLDPAHDLVLGWNFDPSRESWAAQHAFARLIQAGGRWQQVATACPLGDPAFDALPAPAQRFFPRSGSELALVLGAIYSVTAARGLDNLPPRWRDGADAWPLSRSVELTNLTIESLSRLCSEWLNATRPAIVFSTALGWPAAGDALLRALGVLARVSGATFYAPAEPRDPTAALPRPLDSGSFVEVHSGEVTARLAALDPKRCVVILDGGDPQAIPGQADLWSDFLRRARTVIGFAGERPIPRSECDLVVPISSALERAERVGVAEPPALRDAEPVLLPPRDLVDEWQFWRRVARTLGWPGHWFPADPSTLRGEPAEPVEETPQQAPHPELFGGIPAFVECGDGPQTTPDLVAGFRLNLAVQFGGEEEPTPEVYLHPSTAQARRLVAGARVVVHNERGALTAVLRSDERQPLDRALVLVGPSERALICRCAALDQVRDDVGVAGWAPTLVEVSEPE